MPKKPKTTEPTVADVLTLQEGLHVGAGKAQQAEVLQDDVVHAQDNV